MKGEKVYINDVHANPSGLIHTIEDRLITNGLEIVKGDGRYRDDCDYILYLITPKMKGIKTIVDAVNDSNHHKHKTLFCTIYIDDDLEFSHHQKKSIVATGKMIQLNGGIWVESLDDLYQQVVPK